MLQRDYPDQVCSIARSLEVIGERWTRLILRDALVDLTRFEEFQAKLGIASNLLTNRLKRLGFHRGEGALCAAGHRQEKLRDQRALHQAEVHK